MTGDVCCFRSNSNWAAGLGYVDIIFLLDVDMLYPSMSISSVQGLICN